MDRTHYDANAETRSNAGSSSSTTLPATAIDDKEHKEHDNHITESNNGTSSNNNPSGSTQEKQTDSADHDEYEVQWNGLNDPENPKALKKSTKWFVTIVVSMGALCVLVYLVAFKNESPKTWNRKFNILISQ